LVFWIFFFKNKICDGGILDKKEEEEVKMVELQQFESLGKEGEGG
jgi:hypothetical protein